MKLYGSVILIKTFYGKNIYEDDDDLKYRYNNFEIKLDLPVEIINFRENSSQMTIKANSISQMSESLCQFIGLVNLFMKNFIC